MSTPPNSDVPAPAPVPLPVPSGSAPGAARGSAPGAARSTAPGVSPETAPQQDIFSVIGTMFKECSSKWNENANENLDILSRDLQSLYTQFGSLVYQKSNMLNLSAEEIRNKTIEDLYNAIKFGILSCRNNCRYVHTTVCQSEKILHELEKRLSSEGFQVKWNIQDKNSMIVVTW